jgi:micrococcal nuclease
MAKRSLVALAVVSLFGCGSSSPTVERGGEVVRVVDGDTLIASVDGDTERVRVLGIDTPELAREGAPAECGAEAATVSLRRLAAPGADMRLVTDADTGDVRDQYDRLLAFATIDGRDVGLEQLRRGWAHVYAYRDRRFTGRARYERAEDVAARDRRGIHGACTPAAGDR